MAALTTLALLAAAGAKTALSYSEEQRSAKIVEQQGNAQANLIRTNATLAGNQAADAIARGDQGANRMTLQGRQLLGDQRAALAGQGVDVTTGSAADVVENDQRLSALDALTIRQNAAREAYGFKVQSAGYSAQADWVQAAARNTAAGIRRQSVGTLLGGAGEMANIWASAPKGVSTSTSRATTGGIAGISPVRSGKGYTGGGVF